MVRWLLLLVFVAALGVAFRTHSPLILGLALLVALIAFIGTVMGFVSARVDSVSSGQSSRELDLLLAHRAKLAKAASTTAGSAAAPGVTRPATPRPSAPRSAAPNQAIAPTAAAPRPPVRSERGES